ncbi:GNAT family N-acetyltransferase [Rossellomorea sp. NS-SX7]|uniref:GNAT family N-acetyltransferase n=1 Tax=Rossellomorea sp. NS-SX7 TaxID=3463856 RepID=UPI004059C6B3
MGHVMIRQEVMNDFKAIKDVNDLAFKKEDESILIEKIRESEAYIPELSLVGFTDRGFLAGHILFSKIHIENDAGEMIPSIALAPVAVHPEYQGEGIGTSLIQEGIARARNLGYTSVIVLGHPTYYPRFGFKRASEFSIKAPFDIGDEFFMAMELEKSGLKGITGTVRYSEPFGI